MIRKVPRSEVATISSRYASDILRDIERRLRISLDSLLEGCQIVGYDWRYLYVNETAARQGLRKREELLGRTMMEMYPGIETTPLFEELRACMEKRTSRRFRNHFVFPDRTHGWFELSIEPVPEGIFILSIDVTADVRRDEALSESEERFRLISENVSDLITLLDVKGRRLFVSPSVRSLFGEAKRLNGSDFFADVHEDDRARLRGLFDKAIREGTGYRTEYRLVVPDGRIRIIESSANSVRSPEGTVVGVVKVGRDITERKMMEEQYLRAQRLDTIGALAGGVAHDLNNVLAPILVSIAALRRLVPEGKAHAILNTLEESATRGAGLVRQVLSFTRGGETGLGPVALEPLVGEIARLVNVSFPRSIEMRHSIPKNLWKVTAVATQLHQVLMNLIVNARDAMPEGGTLAIEAENVTVGTKNPLDHPGVPPGAYAAVSVTDTGTGIPEETLGKIFEPFFTTKDPGKGTGLGLSTTQSIVRSHNGHLNVRSEVGKGTTFTVYLPRDRSEPSAEPAAAVAVNGSAPGHGEVVLLVEDELALREITRSSLEAYGFTVIPAADGAEALAIYEDRGGSIDIIVTEIMMPFMDGHAMLRSIQAVNPGVRAIVVSGLVKDEYRTKYPDTANVRYLQKPYTAEALTRAIRTLLDGPAARPV